MKYFAIVLMPAKNGQQYFKLTSLLENSTTELSQLKNEDKLAAYQCHEHNNFDAALEMVQALHPAELYENAAQDLKRYMTARVTHAILEVGDDVDEKLPLKNFVTRIFLLQPDGYPHLELGERLDIVEDEIKRLKKAGADSATAEEEQKLAFEAATKLHEKLLADLELALTKPLEFKGPQFDKLVQPAANAREAAVATRESGNVRPSGFFSTALRMSSSENSDEECEAAPTTACQKRH